VKEPYQAWRSTSPLTSESILQRLVVDEHTSSSEGPVEFVRNRIEAPVGTGGELGAVAVGDQVARVRSQLSQEALEGVAAVVS